MSDKIAVVSGSFDPFTDGHEYVIRKAYRMFDKVHIVIASNPNKKHMFTEDERVEMIANTLTWDIASLWKLHKNETLVHFCQNVLSANYIVRGVRNVTDFEYEYQLNLIQKKLAPNIETIFVMCPRELTEVSSSLIRSSVELNDMELIIKDYVSPYVLHKMQEIRMNKSFGIK